MTESNPSIKPDRPRKPLPDQAEFPFTPDPLGRLIAASELILNVLAQPDPLLHEAFMGNAVRELEAAITEAKGLYE